MVYEKTTKELKNCTLKTYFELSLYKAKDKQCWQAVYSRLVSGIAVKLQMNLHILLAARQRVCRDLLAWSSVCVGPEHRPNLPLVYLVYYNEVTFTSMSSIRACENIATRWNNNSTNSFVCLYTSKHADFVRQITADLKLHIHPRIE